MASNNSNKLVRKERHGSPFNVAVILPPISKLPAELYTSEGAALASNVANELDGAMHATRNIHNVADLNVSPVAANRPAGRRPWTGLACGQGAERDFARHCRAGAVQVRWGCGSDVLLSEGRSAPEALWCWCLEGHAGRRLPDWLWNNNSRRSGGASG